MAWKVVDRTRAPADQGPGLSEAVKEKVRSFFPRYPTKQAAILPALHITQEANGYISLQAMKDIAELLELTPAQVLDVVTFYTHFWTHAKGKKVVVLCRSLSCQLMGSDNLQRAIQEQLGIGEHETTPDGAYSFMTEECLAACDHAPCFLINEKMHKQVQPEAVERILSDPDNAKLEIPRSDLFDAPNGQSDGVDAASAAGGVKTKTRKPRSKTIRSKTTRSKKPKDE